MRQGAETMQVSSTPGDSGLRVALGGLSSSGFPQRHGLQYLWLLGTLAVQLYVMLCTAGLQLKSTRASQA